MYGAAALTDFCLSINTSTSCKSDTAGFVGGAFYNFPRDSRLTLGIDGRGSFATGSRGGMSATAAFRLGFVPTHDPLRPYFEVGAGVVSSAGGDPLQAKRQTSGAGQFAVGLDVRLTDRLDLRAIEVGAAAGSSTTTTPSAGTAYFDAGLVYHFARRKS
ncbi:MAG TPA: hypothetical protein VGU23_01285 [Acidobacteriaceae bacterium]|nr:hypothetical protein [Acidobacteriaceae bacterium]